MIVVRHEQREHYCLLHILLLILLSIHGSLGVANQPSVVLPPPASSTASPGNANTNSSITSAHRNAQVAVSMANNFKPLLQAALAVAPAPTAAIADGQSVAQTVAGQQLNNHRAPVFIEQQQQQPSTALSYGNEDPIIYLDYSTISDEILRKRTANFVYFNANFDHCRNCHKFFNIWKDLAVDIRWWKQVIRLFAINCSDEDNIETCRRAGVTQFPQVKYYWIMSNSLEQDGQRLRILGKSVHAMRHLIMDKVLDSYDEHNKFLNQRNKQQNLQPNRAPPISLLAASPHSPSTTATPPSLTNPLAALMSNPLLDQLMGSISGATNGLDKENSGSSSSATSISMLMNSFGGAQGLSQMMSAMLGAGSARKKFSIQPLPSNWPEFEPIEAQDTQQLIDMLPLDASKSIGALLIMETQEFLYTGLEVMLDLNPYANQTYIARVKDERSRLSKNLTKRDEIQGPALIYVTASREPKLIMTAPKYTNDEDLRRAFVRAFDRRQVKYPVKRIWSIPIAVNEQQQKQLQGKNGESQEDEDILGKVNQVYMNDLTNALRTSLMEQVFRHIDLSDDQYNALVKYVYALINYFPFNNDESLKFFKRLHSWLQNQVSPMDIGEYKKQFHDIDDTLQQRDWIACKSLSNTKAIPSKSKSKSLSLFEDPAQLGKVVSNITRLFRGQQQQAHKLKNLFSVFTSPSILNQQNSTQRRQGALSDSGSALPGAANVAPANSAATATKVQDSSSSSSRESKHDDSPIEGIIKGLTSGSLGSDSSILKLISAALTNGGPGDSSSSKSKFAREYPCGAWELAHVMVVNEYIKDSPRKDVKHIVLHSLYQYMLYFYACPTCGNRVSDVSSEFRLNLDEHLQDQGDSVMLLWKMHNRVNKRLESELRPGSPPRVQFPTESLCPKCRVPRTQNDLISTPNWHEKQVLSFLVHHYRPQSLVINPNSTAADFVPSSATSTKNVNLMLVFSINFIILMMSSRLDD